MSKLNLGEIISVGKTKQILKTNNPNIVAFQQLGNSVTADGTQTVKASSKAYQLLIEGLVMQNDNIFTLLNNMGIETTFKGMERVDNIMTLYHEACMPYKLEFVYRPSACNASSILQREPTEFGKFENGKHSNIKVSDEFIAPDQSTIPLKQTRLETFHKLCLIELANGSIDMVLESEAKKDRRYFSADGKNTNFAHPDPMLIAHKNAPHFWYVYDQKKPIGAVPLAAIDREYGILHDMNLNKVRDMKPDEFVSIEQEKYMRNQTQQIMDIISAASLMTNLRNPESGEIMGRAFVADGKVEFGFTKDGKIKLTDDMVTDNFRMFVNGISTLSARRLFQNYEDEDGKLKVIRMYEEATRIWKDPRFVNSVNYVLNLGKKR